MSRIAAVDRVVLFQSGSTILEDTFTDTNGTALASHTPDTANNSAAWTQAGTEDLVVTSNQANSSAVATGDCFNIIDLQNQDLTVEATVQVPTNTASVTVDIVCRYIDKDNYIGLRLSHFGLINLVSVAITAVVDGVAGGFGDVTYITGADEHLPLDFKAVSNSSSIVVSVNGGAEVTYVSDIFNNSTKAAIVPSGTGVTIDDFKVTKT